MKIFDALACRTHCRNLDGEFFVLTVWAEDEVAAEKSAVQTLAVWQAGNPACMYSVLKVGPSGSMDSKVCRFERLSDD